MNMMLFVIFRAKLNDKTCECAKQNDDDDNDQDNDKNYCV